jgi:hypothetical protein
MDIVAEDEEQMVRYQTSYEARCKEHVTFEKVVRAWLDEHRPADPQMPAESDSHVHPRPPSNDNNNDPVDEAEADDHNASFTSAKTEQPERVDEKDALLQELPEQ